MSAGNGLFKGVRDRAAYYPGQSTFRQGTPIQPGMLRDPRLTSGVAMLGKYGLVFDAWVFHTQLLDLAALAATTPATAIVLEHLGGPMGIRGTDKSDVLMEWHSSMKQLAAIPNIYIKVGGLGMDILGGDWHTRGRRARSDEIVQSYGEHVTFIIDTFSPSRCMFESNFPADRASFSYGSLWNALKRISRHYSPTERGALFHNTATSVYGLESR